MRWTASRLFSAFKDRQGLMDEDHSVAPPALISVRTGRPITMASFRGLPETTGFAGGFHCLRIIRRGISSTGERQGASLEARVRFLYAAPRDTERGLVAPVRRTRRVAQRHEHLRDEQGGEGSSPSAPTRRPMVQELRMPVSDTGGVGASPTGATTASVTQPEEYRSHKAGAGGSNPPRCTRTTWLSATVRLTWRLL